MRWVAIADGGAGRPEYPIRQRFQRLLGSATVLEFYYNPYAWLPVYAFVLHLGLASLVYFAAPYRLPNRILGALLFSNALYDVALVLSFTLEYPDVRAAWATLGVAQVVTWAVWLLLLGYVLDTPLTKPIRTRWGLTIAGVYFATLIAAMLYDASLLIGQVNPGLVARWEFQPGPFYSIPLLLWFLFNVFALVAAVDAYRRTRKGTLARTRAGSLLVGFGSANLTNVLLLLLVRARGPERLTESEVVPWVLLAIANVTVFSVALVYGILKAELFDVRLRIRWTVGRGALAAIFVATFFIAGQLAENLAGRLVGDQAWILGAVASGLLLFALQPLQRVSERIANTVVPNARSVAALPLSDRLAMYREQLEAAWEDGSLSKAERRVLEVSRARLGLTFEQSRTVEVQVLR